MKVITTHINADFDALASMLAAKKIYPDAVVVFPGSQEKNLRKFFLESTLYALEIERIRNVDFDEVDKLILVDIRQSDRIGRFEALIGKPGVEIDIYDHHPASPKDIEGTFEVCRPVGANASLMTAVLEERGIEISPEEATILMLGIYEDTGSLTFSSTTVDDYHAAATLLRKGADLNTVSDFITNELTIDQVTLLNELIESMETHSINGVDVVVTRASMDRYVGDLAVLVHKLKDMENLNVLFAVARMEDRIFMVARSRVDEVDVSSIARAFGGGGHATAASATIRDMTLYEAVEKLRKVLQAEVRPLRTARDLMSTPVKTVGHDETIETAEEMLTRYNINVLPVLAAEKPVGFITRQVVEKATFHGLGHVKVKDYMMTDFESVDAETPLSVIQQLVVEQRQRIVPVVADDDLLGVITRTDILNAIHQTTRSAALDGRLPQMRRKRIRRLLEERLSERICGLLREIGDVAEALGVTAYVVGGFVRDLLMRSETLDVDIVIEGDAIEFAKAFADGRDCRVRSHSMFHTAVMIFPDGFKVDVATARLEYYEEPAALPNVEGSSIKLDLYRRDFTINALAVCLNPESFGELIDFFGAQRDIKDHTIRVLHNLSFVEDPTRIFRAIRFERRFNFRIGKHTLSLMRSTIKSDFPGKLSGKRLLAEVRLIFQEAEPYALLKRIDELGLLPLISPGIKVEKRLQALFSRIKEVLSWFDLLFLEEACRSWMVYFMGLTAFLTDEEMAEICRRLEMSDPVRREMAQARVDLESISRAFRRIDPLKQSEVYRLLDDRSRESILFLMAHAETASIRQAVSTYFTAMLGVKAHLSGEDLKAMGLEPGPSFRKILDEVVDGQLDGEIENRQDALDYVRGKWAPEFDGGEDG